MKIKVLVLFFSFIHLPCFSQSTADSLKITHDHFRTKNVKINLLPTWGGRLDVSWEKLRGNHQSYDIGLNAIGLVTNDRYAAKGVILHVGYKFFFQQPLTNDEKFHPMNGFYIEPTVMAGYTERLQTYLEPVDGVQGGRVQRERILSAKYAAAFCNLGRQFILYNRFSLDFTVGLGLGAYSGRLSANAENEYTPSNKPQRYGFMVFGGNNVFGLTVNAPVAMNAGIRLGYVFK